MKRYIKNIGASNTLSETMSMDKEAWNSWEVEARINGILRVDIGYWKDRQYEELMRVRSSQKAVMRNTKDDIEDEENNRQNKSICNPPHKAHVDAICHIVKGMFGKPKN